jgi:hypothetical protein
LPQIRIDPSQALADIGLRPTHQIAKEEAQQGQEAILEYIAQIAREGDRFARIEVSTNVVAELAREKWPDTRQVNIDYAPKHRVDIRVAEGRVEGTFRPGRVIVELAYILVAGRKVDVRA